GRSCGPEAAREVVQAVCRAYNKNVCPDYTDDEIITAREKWAEILHTMHRHGKFSTGNDVQILEGGDVCFPIMLDAIDSAKDRVWMESYIFDGSAVAEKFYQALIRAKQRGVDVILILDACGGSAFRKEWLEGLRSIGVPVVVFNPMLPFLTDTIGPPCFRDHRKILVADSIGFCGSMNIHQETCSSKMGGDGHFYDVHSRMRGPCVKDLADVIISSLKESGSDITREPIPDIPAVAEPGMYVQVLNSCVRRQDYGLQRSLQLLLKNTITRRKVKTSLLVSGNSDFWPLPGDLMAQTHAVRQFVGLPECEVSMYATQHMHAKYSSFDGVYSFLGSNNFDRYSTRRNLECSIGVMDRGFAEGIRSIHEDKKHKGFKPSLDDCVCSFLSACHTPTGGFAGGPGQLSHLACTYAAVASLVIVGTEEAYRVVNRPALYRFLISMKDRSTGGFRVHENGETDMRGCYCAIAVARMMKLLTPELEEGVVGYIKRCQTWEGGLAGEPGLEAHGGYGFCGLAAATMLGKAEEALDLERLARWVCQRQFAFEGTGICGRLIERGQMKFSSSVDLVAERVTQTRRKVYEVMNKSKFDCSGTPEYDMFLADREDMVQRLLDDSDASKQRLAQQELER
ncbi:protein farnesyltransferase beta subunit, putative, partial [Perkinsus marinus ATCC 50983]